MDDNNLSFIECAATTGVAPGASRDTEIRNFGPVGVDAIQQIAIEQLESHSSNPRLILREDVIEVIRAEIAEHGFRNEHALLVRPLGDKFQIISGHQRIEAARRAKLKTVPWWVREMGDEETLMQLVLSNAQGELSGLEYGIHALMVVGKAEPGRGKRGGYSEYARQIGKGVSLVSRLALGAEVFGAVKSLTRVNDLLDRLDTSPLSTPRISARGPC